METNANRLRKYSGITLGIVLVTAFVLVQPTMQTSYAQVVDEGAPAFESCEFYYADQAEDPFSMNTVRVKDVAKTVIVEKEIFRCDTVQGDVDLLVHVATFAEIFENMTSKSIIAKRALVVSCAKLDITSGDGGGVVIGCDTYTPKTDFIPVTQCFDITDNYLEHPQEMNTVNKGNTVKTIEAEKEVFYCNFSGSETGPNGGADDNDKKVEQYIITEIWENVGLLPEDTIVQKNVESLRCWTLVDLALVESCQFTTVQLQEVDPFE